MLLETSHNIHEPTEETGEKLINSFHEIVALQQWNQKVQIPKSLF